MLQSFLASQVVLCDERNSIGSSKGGLLAKQVAWWQHALVTGLSVVATMGWEASWACSRNSSSGMVWAFNNCCCCCRVSRWWSVGLALRQG